MVKMTIMTRGDGVNEIGAGPKGGPRPNRPRPGGLRSEGCGSRSEAEVRNEGGAGSEALNVICDWS